MRSWVPLLLAVVLGAAGCSTSAGGGAGGGTGGDDATGAPEQSPTATESPGLTYVALGDSYTAAPGVPPPDSASGGCFRSSANYPALVAADLTGAALSDVSCSGADTRDLTRRQQTFGGDRVPAQLDALSRGTDLVTIGMGGNDFSVFGTLIGYCTSVRNQDPTGSPCSSALGDGLFGSLDKMGDRMTRALHRIVQRSPHAQVLVVGYPVLIGSGESCPSLLPLATGDVDFAVEVNQRLNDELRAAARATGTTYVDVAAAGKKHTICSAHPWVNGGASTVGAQLFHPFEAEQRAVADLILDLVG